MTNTAVRNNANAVTHMKFGNTFPVIATCSQCLAVRVAELGDVCIPCVTVIDNRVRMASDRERRITFWRHVAIIVGIIAIGVWASAWMNP